MIELDFTAFGVHWHLHTEPSALEHSRPELVVPEDWDAFRRWLDTAPMTELDKLSAPVRKAVVCDE